jgi:TetR/AcrR family transcriptional regulator, transcriptional repressor of bet genes
LPKLGMGPIRREQICRAAAKVISEQGFAGTTMRMVAEEAGVSTGMLNHYFANRMEMLEATLLFVSMRQQARETAATEGTEPGEERLRALVRSTLPTDQETTEAWRVWIAAWGASVRLPHLRSLMTQRDGLWFSIIERSLEGIVPRSHQGKVPFVWRLDAMINGLVIHALATEDEIPSEEIENAVMALALEHSRAIADGASSAAEAPVRRRRAAGKAT